MQRPVPACRMPRRSRASTLRRRTRWRPRPVVLAGLVLVGVLAPVAGARLPAPLDELAGTRAASAQPAVIVDGAPGLCPSTPVQWVPSGTGAECVLEMEPCPAAPVFAGLRLVYSVGYPDTDGLNLVEYPVMCELRILEPNDPVAYGECASRTGYVKMLVPVDHVLNGLLTTSNLCRLLQPAECPAGVQVEPDVCTAIQRRSWSCPSDYKPMNTYLKCYRLSGRPPGTTHPACGDGAPSFVAQSCADYVDVDFADPPGPIDCEIEYPTVNPPDPQKALSANSKPGASSDYWCEFNEAFLKTACHALNPPATECAASTAMCLKRASGTGGCSAIANTIRCRALQQAFEAGTTDAAAVRSEGCAPCVLLPFSPVSSDCPRDLTSEPKEPANQAFHDLIALREDFDFGSRRCSVDYSGSSPTISAACRARPTCTDPPVGALTWTSSHFTQLAIVNSPVVLALVDVPVEERDGPLSVSGSGLSGGRLMFAYPGSPPGALGDSIVTFGRIDPSDDLTDAVDAMVVAYGECVYIRGPHFDLAIRQLWPDDPADRTEIRRLFGSSALDWWDALTTPAERRASIEARGLGYWPDLSAAERAQRTAELTENVMCNYEIIYRLPIWCRWVPTDSGLFRIIAGGAWYGRRYDSGSRGVIRGSDVWNINRRLANANVRALVVDQLAAANAARVAAGLPLLTPSELGLNDTLTAVLPLSDIDDVTKYSGLRTERACRGTDVRIRCGHLFDGVGSGNYTETEPIGVAVHEVRVATRPPNP